MNGCIFTVDLLVACRLLMVHYATNRRASQVQQQAAEGGGAEDGLVSGLRLALDRQRREYSFR